MDSSTLDLRVRVGSSAWSAVIPAAYQPIIVDQPAITEVNGVSVASAASFMYVPGSGVLTNTLNSTGTAFVANHTKVSRESTIRE